MLVPVSGSQGCGKTTIINELYKAGHPIIQRKTSRSILSEWGVSLNEVNQDPQLTMKFQEEIIRRKFLDEKEAIESDQIVFTERTYADLFTYALVALGRDNDFDDWLRDYYLRCMTYQQSYSMVFYLTAGHFTVQKDGVRASNKQYSTLVDLSMQEFTRQMTSHNRLNIVSTPVLQERKTIIEVQTLSALNPAAFNLNLLQSL
jgi:predicted ATPase